MGNKRKEQIIIATLELVAEKGFGNVSMSMIAEKIGIKKPSLYNHFTSKEDIVKSMYESLREKAKDQYNHSMVDYGALLKGRTALEVMNIVVENYRKMNSDKQMLNFYKAIYSERCINSLAAEIMVEETEKMILATKQLFYAMQVHGMLHFSNPDISAISFAMTIHSLMEYEMDITVSGKTKEKKDKLIDEYLQWFCLENK